MRLTVINEKFAGQDVPDVLKLASHRPEVFGAHQGKASEDLLRGPSEWSIGERELFGAFVSSENQCPF